MNNATLGSITTLDTIRALLYYSFNEQERLAAGHTDSAWWHAEQAIIEGLVQVGFSREDAANILAMCWDNGESLLYNIELTRAQPTNEEILP